MEAQKYIYCDLDGVLVDFDGGFISHFGLPPKEYEKLHGVDKFWEVINYKGSKFWKNLPPTPYKDILWEYIFPHCKAIITAPSKDISSFIGKYEWVKYHLTPLPKILYRSSHLKQEVLFNIPDEDKTNHILIDDRKDITQNWIKAGGSALHHKTIEDTILQLNKIYA